VDPGAANRGSSISAIVHRHPVQTFIRPIWLVRITLSVNWQLSSFGCWETRLSSVMREQARFLQEVLCGALAHTPVSVQPRAGGLYTPKREIIRSDSAVTCIRPISSVAKPFPSNRPRLAMIVLTDSQSSGLCHRARTGQGKWRIGRCEELCGLLLWH
jgi:hypothetical protein